MTFAARHIGLTPKDVEAMLATCGYASVGALIDQTVPAHIRQQAALRLPAAAEEAEVLSVLEDMAQANEQIVSLIGTGYHATHTPPVLKRLILHNPAWYTAYTPYQPEISQGRLEALLVFQTVVADLTGLPLAGASLLDEATACAEGMALVNRVNEQAGDVFVVDPDTHPQNLAVLRTRAEPLGLEIAVTDPGGQLPDGTFGVLVQYPGSSGQIPDLGPIVEAAHAAGALVVVSADPLALTLLPAPGDLGADVAVGSTQRFGTPLWYGGPHAGYLATRDEHRRQLPGRLVGVSVDADGQMALRLALQTREQHIRRQKATSNICTAQVLLAVLAGAYAVWHGPEGLTGIAERVADLTARTHAGLVAGGVEVLTTRAFDTLTVRVPGRAGVLLDDARRFDLELRPVDADHLAFSFDEATTARTAKVLCEVFGATLPASAPDLVGARRTSSFLEHPVFHEHRSETSMMRYLRRLADADLALDRTMIPLGSCTMKLNAAAELEPITWKGFADIHPHQPPEQTLGYHRLIEDLERWLAEITGYDAVSIQPNAGSQGELAGLLAIRAYHADRGEPERDVCLIPSSAHGTNAASAVMAGMRVVVVACDEAGNVDLDDVRAKADEHAGRLAALMVTYPSTHGVFEEGITELCRIVHDHGGQVYLDGANLNALVGVARPGEFGADVSHLNLHKTFCIPHGGGGPGVGPVAARAHLAPFLPGREHGRQVSAAASGSAGILPISWAYIRLMGPDGLRAATEAAILSANYVAQRLGDAYPILYQGSGGTVAHECILDLRALTKRTGVTAEDVAKRLIDFGFHAPTMAFPVAGTLMVEPTESESKRELDRFVDAMVTIRAEIQAIADGEIALQDSPLRRAPHTAANLLTGEWDRPYTREQAAYPGGVTASKYWPPVSRIDQAYGDKHLVCACPPIEAYE